MGTLLTSPQPATKLPSTKLQVLLDEAVDQLEEVVRIFDKLGANRGFEEVMAVAANNMRAR